MKRGKCYDCEPLSLSILERCLKDAGFSYENLSEAAVRVMLSVEMGRDLKGWLLRSTPPGVFCKLDFIVPTLIYRLGVQNRQ